MLIDDLRKLLPPPKHPLETGEVPVWEVLRRAFGIDFPNEYTQFINCVSAPLREISLQTDPRPRRDPYA